MSGKIARPIQRGFLGIADRDRADRRLADFRLKGDLDAMLLQPCVELLQAAPGLHAYHRPARHIRLKPQNLVELAQAHQCAAIIDNRVGDGSHRADRADGRWETRHVADDCLNIAVTQRLGIDGWCCAAMPAPIGVASARGDHESLHGWKLAGDGRETNIQFHSSSLKEKEKMSCDDGISVASLTARCASCSRRSPSIRRYSRCRPRSRRHAWRS